MKLKQVNDDFDGFQKLINLYEKNREVWFETINLEIENFFAAHMCAPLAVILDLFMSNLNSISLNAQGKVKDILQRNGFLTAYGYEDMFDYNDTTIPFRKFSRTESKSFVSYVKNKLLARKDIPDMSIELKKYVLEAISEIFSNACMHTTTRYVYACGQFFPNKYKLDFTLADQGEGFREIVSNFLNESMSSTEAINWALKDGNTTKKNIPGGYGLTILKNLIEHNKGFMQIVSDDGFYKFSHNGEISRTFQGKFPGTVVNLQFRTDDTASYYIKKS